MVRVTPDPIRGILLATTGRELTIPSALGAVDTRQTGEELSPPSGWPLSGRSDRRHAQSNPNREVHEQIVIAKARA